ncbi:hypothetical protein L3Q82_005925 [Scortum barcoo]|uniref:Uncharacterized protein n=1 Tax=Scortum barcoo TaxID=214431 RepID=A0ACB8X1Z3_9TELE|nr:hypothetical protein L3Q82_005925 [Scortum barcoo]
MFEMLFHSQCVYEEYEPSYYEVKRDDTKACLATGFSRHNATLNHEYYEKFNKTQFADDTAVVGRIANNDESDYRQEVEHLEGWCRQNNLCINVKKTKEMIVDFRRGRHLPSPLYIGGTAVEVVSSFRYLGVHISDDLTWSKNTSCLIRKAHQRLYFLRRLRRAGLGSSVLTSFYRCVVESVLSSCIIVWHGSCSAAEKKALQRVVKAAQRTVGRSLPTTMDIYTSRCRKQGLLHHEGPHSHCTHCTVSEAEPCEDTLEPDPMVNLLSLTVLGLRLIFLKTIVFNVLMTFRLWISQCE